MMKTKTPIPPVAALAIAITLSGLAGCSISAAGDPVPAGPAAGAPREHRIPPARFEPPAAPAAPAPQQADGPSLVSLSAGALVVRRPSEWADFASAFHLLDETSKSIWATKPEVTSPQTIVIALPERTILTTLQFDSGSAEMQFAGCSAKDVTVEMSDEGEDAGFRQIARVSLRDRRDAQRFRATAEVPGRWVRLTVANNHGSTYVTELGEFRAYGTQLTRTPFADVSGTYNAYYTDDLHFRQEGASIAGCYESRNGLFEGGVEGHVFRFTYRESGLTTDEGRGIMVFSPDRQRFVALWWERFAAESQGRLVIGTRVTDDVGSCGHWTGGAGEQMSRALDESGRARVYGITFDADSDVIRPEARPTLDAIAAVLQSKPDWRMTIEGHTDSTATAEHNQSLSERRAMAVRDYLRAAGTDVSRLKAVGYGSTQPVATNDTELGRAQNRRVELAKE